MSLHAARVLSFCLVGAAASIALAQDPLPPQQGQGIPDCAEMSKTSSGLEYGVLAKGPEGGQPPGAGDTVKVHYTGWLTDGTKFDSSRDRGQPAEFPLNRVIPGWTEGLQLMVPGDRFKFVIPGDLAYGPNPRPGSKIPPNATLVFDVELLEVLVRVPSPECPPKTDAKVHTLDSGVTYQVLAAGDGAIYEAGDGLALQYALYRVDKDAEGQAGKTVLLDCSEWNQGRRISGAIDSLPFPWLKEIAAKMSTGTKVRVEVPEKLFPNARGDSVWTFAATIGKVPAFRMPDPAKVVTTGSGLAYEVIAQGSATSPKVTDTVVAHYTGWLTDGKVFDSSHRRCEPTSFPLDGVIKGWTEGLQLMGVGGKYLFAIPGALAYGPNPPPGSNIPPDATLVFLVELVEIK